MRKTRTINVNPWGMEVEFSFHTGKLVLIFPEYRPDIDTEIKVRINIDFSWVSYIREILRLKVLDKVQHEIDDAKAN